MKNKLIPLTRAMKKLMAQLEVIVSNPVVEAAYNEAIAHVQPVLYPGAQAVTGQDKNPWVGQPISYFVEYFREWFTFLPQPEGGLGKIVPFTYFYLDNPQAFYFLNYLESKSGKAKKHSKEIFNWTVAFIKERGNFMDSPASAKYIKEWEKYLGKELKNYIIPKGGFKTFNEFFTRELNPKANPRPISHPDDDSILTASADSEINFIESDLTMTTSLSVKSRQLNVKELLNNSKYAEYFEGGTAISCVLMPNNYHHYHSPVTGKIVESMIVPGIYNGIMDGEDWFNNFNVGESTTDFSIFEDFHRAYFVYQTKNHGYVAMMPVGLNTISSIHPSVIGKRSTLVPPGGKPVPVQKGQEVGHFAYGGSLNILLFQKGVFSSVNVLMGQRIGTLGTPS
ncbi:MAG: phosphatidylserine decarboxylase [Bacteroidota bacterium]